MPYKTHKSHTSLPRRRFSVHNHNSYQRYHILHLLASGLLHLAVLLQTDGGHANEASGLGGSEVADLVHAGFGHVVQLLSLGGTAKDDHVTLVGAAADLAVDGLLGGRDGLLKELTLGGEVETVVEDLSQNVSNAVVLKGESCTNLGVVDSDELVTQSTDLTVEHKTLKVTRKGQLT